jgi:hypothetical protein
MGLTPVLKLVSIAQDASSITVADGTGAYHATTNPGGFGGPNPTSVDMVAAVIRMASYSSLNAYSSKRFAKTNLLTEAGQVLQKGDFPAANPGATLFPDSVYNAKYHPVYAGTGTISYTAGSKEFTLTNASTILAFPVVGIIIPSVDNSRVYFIDRTKTLNGSGGSVTEAFPNTAGNALAYEIVYEGDLKILVSKAGDNCLTEDLGIWAENDCQDDEFRDVWRRYRMKIAMSNKFTKGYLFDAHNLAVKLASYCGQTIIGGDCGCN